MPDTPLSPESPAAAAAPAWAYKLLLDLNETVQLTGVSRSGVYRGVEAGTFPAPVRQPGNSRPFWRRKDLERWAERLRPGRPRARREPV